MKKLSIEEKARRYDEAIARANGMIKAMTNIGGVAKVDDIQYIFPELKESEDEMIRQKILFLCYSWRNNEQVNIPDKKEVEKMIAWLEKQESVGEIVKRCKTSWYNEGKIQGQIEGLSDEEKYQQGWHDALEKQGEQKPNYCHHEVDLSDCTEEYRKAYYDGWNNCNQQHAQLEAEHIPAWSEEDERNLEGIIDEIEANKNDAPDYDLATYDRFLSWLKSLKVRYTWKPSDEQIEALDSATENCAYSEYQDCLRELIEQLKKLK